MGQRRTGLGAGGCATEAGEETRLRKALGRGPRATLDALAAVLLAPSCLCCGTLIDRPLEGPVCCTCWRSIAQLSPPLCTRCGDALPTWRLADLASSVCTRCRRRPPRITLARAAGSYEGALRQVLHSLKYERRRTLAAPVAALMRQRGAEVLREADILVPVPLHWIRRRRRGFNQALDLARHLGLPVVDALRRVRATSPQSGLSAVGRLRNVANAFGPPRRRWLGARTHDPRVSGACVVLVDDVCTTGGTLEECARVLLEGGAREVRALTAARALWRPR